MKTPLFMLGAATLSLAAGAADAATSPAAVQAFLQDVRAQAQAQMDADGVAPAARTGVVRAYIGADGQLKSVRAATAAAPCAADRDVQHAIRAVRLDNVPAELIDAKLTLDLGQAGVTLAKAP